MAKRISPQKQLRLAVIREYRGSFNSLEHTAEAFNVSPETMKQWLKDIGEGKNPVASDTWSQTHMERYAKSDRFFTGDREMKMTDQGTIEGKHYKIQDFIIKRGERLPETQITSKKDAAYQVIIKGTERGKTVRHATPVSDSVDTAMSIARKMMGEYGRKKGFRGTVAYLRVMTRK